MSIVMFASEAGPINIFLVDCRLGLPPFDFPIEDTHHGKPTESTSVEQI